MMPDAGNGEAPAPVHSAAVVAILTSFGTALYVSMRPWNFPDGACSGMYHGLSI